MTASRPGCRCSDRWRGGTARAPPAPADPTGADLRARSSVWSSRSRTTSKLKPVPCSAAHSRIACGARADGESKCTPSAGGPLAARDGLGPGAEHEPGGRPAEPRAGAPVAAGTGAHVRRRRPAHRGPALAGAVGQLGEREAQAATRPGASVRSMATRRRRAPGSTRPAAASHSVGAVREASRGRANSPSAAPAGREVRRERELVPDQQRRRVRRSARWRPSSSRTASSASATRARRAPGAARRHQQRLPLGDQHRRIRSARHDARELEAGQARASPPRTPARGRAPVAAPARRSAAAARRARSRARRPRRRRASSSSSVSSPLTGHRSRRAPRGRGRRGRAPRPTSAAQRPARHRELVDRRIADIGREHERRRGVEAVGRRPSAHAGEQRAEAAQPGLLAGRREAHDVQRRQAGRRPASRANTGDDRRAGRGVGEVHLEAVVVRLAEQPSSHASSAGRRQRAPARRRARPGAPRVALGTNRQQPVGDRRRGAAGVGEAQPRERRLTGGRRRQRRRRLGHVALGEREHALGDRRRRRRRRGRRAARRAASSSPWVSAIAAASASPAAPLVRGVAIARRLGASGRRARGRAAARRRSPSAAPGRPSASSASWRSSSIFASSPCASCRRRSKRAPSSRPRSWPLRTPPISQRARRMRSDERSTARPRALGAAAERRPAAAQDRRRGGVRGRRREHVALRRAASGAA